MVTTSRPDRRALYPRHTGDGTGAVQSGSGAGLTWASDPQTTGERIIAVSSPA